MWICETYINFRCWYWLVIDIAIIISLFIFSFGYVLPQEKILLQFFWMFTLQNQYNISHDISIAEVRLGIT